MPNPWYTYHPKEHGSQCGIEAEIEVFSKTQSEHTRGKPVQKGIDNQTEEYEEGFQFFEEAVLNVEADHDINGAHKNVDAFDKIDRVHELVVSQFHGFQSSVTNENKNGCDDDQEGCCFLWSGDVGSNSEEFINQDQAPSSQPYVRIDREDQLRDSTE